MDIIQQIKKGKIDNLKPKDLENILRIASEHYYNEGNSIINDELYDILKIRLQKLDPKNSVLNEIGANEKNAVDLPFWMGSLDKIRDDEKAIIKWKNTYEGEYILSDKLDGNSGLLVYNKGKVNLYSRGNGHKGQNLSSIIKHLHIPIQIPYDNVAIRGELIISKENWEKIKDKGANARNVVAGLLHSKIPNPEIVKYLEFVAYELVYPKIKPSLGLAEIQKLGIQTAYHELINDLTINKLSETLLDRRSQSSYEIDGIVVSHDESHKMIKGKNPKYAFAFKSLLTHDEAEAIITQIEWNISKDGYIKPTVLIEPIYLNGVKISRATGYNASFIESNKLGPGAKVVIIRSGDVIPKIVKVVVQTEPQMPEISYKWNNTHVDILIEKSDEINDDVAVRSLEHFTKTMGIKFVANGILKKLVQNNINTIPKLLKITIEDLLKIDGFQQKSAEKVFDSIQNTIKQLSKDDKLCIELMAASNLFGHGIGSKKLKLFVDKYPDIIRKYVELKLEDLIKIKGVSTITAKAFLDGISKYHDFIKKIGIKCESKKESSSSKSNKNKIPSGESIVMTGFRDKELEKIIINAGSYVKTSISKNITMVIAADINDNTGKITKAKELGIKIISKEDFMNNYL